MIKCIMFLTNKIVYTENHSKMFLLNPLINRNRIISIVKYLNNLCFNFLARYSEHHYIFDTFIEALIHVLRQNNLIK